PASQLPAQHRLLRRVHPVEHENTLGRVDANADKIVHGRLPRMRSATTSFWHSDAVGGRPPQQFFGRVLGTWIPAFAGMNGDWFNDGANVNSSASKLPSEILRATGHLFGRAGRPFRVSLCQRHRL